MVVVVDRRGLRVLLQAAVGRGGPRRIAPPLQRPPHVRRVPRRPHHSRPRPRAARPLPRPLLRGLLPLHTGQRAPANQAAAREAPAAPGFRRAEGHTGEHSLAAEGGLLRRCHLEEEEFVPDTSRAC